MTKWQYCPVQQHRRDIRKVLWVHYFNTDEVKRGIKDQLLELDNRNAESKARPPVHHTEAHTLVSEASMTTALQSKSMGKQFGQSKRLNLYPAIKQIFIKTPGSAFHDLLVRHRSNCKARLCIMASPRDKSVTSVTLQPIVPPSQAEAFQDLVKYPQHYTDLRPVKRNEQSPGT